MAGENDAGRNWDHERASQYEQEQILSARWRQDLEFIDKHRTGDVKSILEFGCGPGLLAAALPQVRYVGVDICAPLLERARFRNHPLGSVFKRFLCFDARNYQDDMYDLVIAMHYFHLFALEDNDFDRMIVKVLSHGRRAAFSIYLADFDSAFLPEPTRDIHYSVVSLQRLATAIRATGHEIVHAETVNETIRESGLHVREAYIWTERIPQKAAPEPKKTVHVPQQRLLVDGVLAADFTPYTVRWAGSVGEQVPVLYKDGKRVTQHWWLILDAPAPEDPSGGNANTT